VDQKQYLICLKRFRIIRLEILYIEMAHTIVANKSMFVILAIVRGAVDVRVCMTDGAAAGIVVGPAEGDTVGLAGGDIENIDGESEGTVEGEIDGSAEGETTDEKE
jgi:hypothetical protein